MAEPAGKLPPLPLPAALEPAPEAEPEPKPEPVAEPAAPVEVIFRFASFLWDVFFFGNALVFAFGRYTCQFRVRRFVCHRHISIFTTLRLG